MTSYMLLPFSLAVHSPTYQHAVGNLSHTLVSTQNCCHWRRIPYSRMAYNGSENSQSTNEISCLSKNQGHVVEGIHLGGKVGDAQTMQNIQLEMLRVRNKRQNS